MEKLLFDQSPRSSLDVSLFRSNKSMNNYSSFSSSSSSSYSPYSSGNSLSQFIYNYNATNIPKLNTDAWPLYQNPPLPLSPSLRPSLSLPQPSLPPLLPLPIQKNTSFPSQFNHKKFTAPTAPKRKSRANKKEPRVQSKNVKIPLERKPSVSTADDITNNENMDEETLITNHVKNGVGLDCFSNSPPPSSLPLPGLALLRPRMKRTTACNNEAIFEESKYSSAGVDNGATDNLCRILRLSEGSACNN